MTKWQEKNEGKRNYTSSFVDERKCVARCGEVKGYFFIFIYIKTRFEDFIYLFEDYFLI
jgi:hypothetical protein